ncbi:uncharacterized protein LOC143279384 isoform X2 [Babylonia areolata]
MASGGHYCPKAMSDSLRLTDRLLHEAEDADDISEPYRSDVSRLTTSLQRPPSQRQHTFMSVAVIRVGRRAPPRSSRCVLNVQQREHSFSDFNVRRHQPCMWRGPGPEAMAQAGWRFDSGDSATCDFCTVTVRDWRPEHNPWRRHEEWFPTCPYLRQQGQGASTPSPSGKKLFRHSFPSVYDLERSAF